MEQIIAILAEELKARPEYIQNVIQLLDDGNTIPFIARYRKELHGAMDDTALRTLETRLQYLRGLQERRETVLSAIEEQGKLTEELRRAILAGEDLRENPLTASHADWAEELQRRHVFTEENAAEILRQEVGAVFMQVLTDAGVYKRDQAGKAAFLRFVEAVNR